MSTLGKVLLVLNLLAAAAFAYLAAVDWQERQAWSYAVFRHDLALEGLPLDEEQKDVDGTREVDKLSDKTVQDVFRTVGGDVTPPMTPEDKTQEAEVRRLEKRIRSDVDGLGDEKAKRQRLAAYLVPLETTYGDRERLIRQVQSEPVERLVAEDGPLARAFRPALDRNQDPGRRRDAVAHLLLNVTDPRSTGYERVVAVVGLRAFSAEADRQAAVLRGMASEVDLALRRDRSAFETEYQRRVAELRRLADRLADRQAKLSEYQDLATRQRALLTQRQADVRDLREQIDKARKATAETLAQLAAEQQRLFEAQRDVAEGVAKNLQLERQLLSSEPGAPDGK
jgi:hypothetical protein